MVKLSRKLGIGFLGRTVAGLAFMLSGYLAARAWFLTINASIAWLPWIILAGRKPSVSGRESRVAAHRGALPAVAGRPLADGLVYLADPPGLDGCARCFHAPPGRQILLTGVRLFAASGLAFALGAAQFLPTVEYWWASQHPRVVARSCAK